MGSSDSVNPIARKEVAPRYHMTRELEFVLTCVRRSLGVEQALPSQSGLDWELVRRLAARHSVLPLLKEYFPQNFRNSACVNLALSRALLRVLDLFARERVMAVPLKGPVLAATVYGDLALRMFSDLDLLVRPQDALRARQILERGGYELRSALHWHSASACLRCRESQLSFGDSTGRVSLDLHWRMLPFYFPSAVDEDQVWWRLRPIQFAGTRTMSLSPEDLLLFLCAHGAKHQWARLSWICDVARLLQVERQINWSYVFACAERTKTSQTLYLGLLLASDLLGAEIPVLPMEGASRDLVPVVRKRFFSNAQNPPSPLDAARFCLRCLESRRQRALYIFGTFCRPAEAEYRVLKLPPALHSLYYPLRAARVVRKYAAKRLADRLQLHSKDRQFVE